MQRQHGVFLYDTLNYPLAGHADLEAYLGQPEVSGPDGKVMLTKVLIPHKVGREVFRYDRAVPRGTVTTLLCGPVDHHEGLRRV